MLPALMYDRTLTMAGIRAIGRGMHHSLEARQPQYANFDSTTLGWDFAIPYIAIHGEGAVVSPLASARRHTGRVRSPRTRFVAIPGAGHLVEFAAPDRFLTEVRHVADGLNS